MDLPLSEAPSDPFFDKLARKGEGTIQVGLLLFRPERFREIPRRGPDLGGEIAATEDAQLAHDANVVLGIDKTAPCLHGFKFDAEPYLRGNL